MLDKKLNEKLSFTSGTASSKQIRLSLIPHKGLLVAAKRFELGLEKYADKAWNNLSDNQAALNDKEWLLDRTSHIIEHAYNCIDILLGRSDKKLEDEAGGIAWGGLMLASVPPIGSQERKPPVGSRERIVASNMDSIRCTFCNGLFEANDVIIEYPDGQVIHKFGGACQQALLKNGQL